MLWPTWCLYKSNCYPINYIKSENTLKRCAELILSIQPVEIYWTSRKAGVLFVSFQGLIESTRIRLELKTRSHSNIQDTLKSHLVRPFSTEWGFAEISMKWGARYLTRANEHISKGDYTSTNNWKQNKSTRMISRRMNHTKFQTFQRLTFKWKSNQYVLIRLNLNAL